MALKTLFRRFLNIQEDLILNFCLDGTEKVTYGEIDQVFDRLQAVAAAFAVYPVKDESPDTPLLKWMYELTDGMTSEHVQETFDSVIHLMNVLKNGSEMSYHAEGVVKINKAGALLTLTGMDIGFPFGGVTQKMPEGYAQRRIVERAGEDLCLRLAVDGSPELASACTWTIGRSSGQIRFSLKEARYWQVKDYGRVLLNQAIEAAGRICEAKDRYTNKLYKALRCREGRKPDARS